MDIFDEDDLLPISALQHFMFCKRQYALIHLEQLWNENVLTAEGNLLHERVDNPEMETRRKLKIVRSLRLRSLKWGITGIADVVEFHYDSSKHMWIPFPVEYKRGKPKQDQCDLVQLCAQVLCLEEMLKVEIPKGAFFYGQPKRRFEVDINGSLRSDTVKLIAQLHEFARDKKTPPAIYQKKCENCSLIDLCMPKSTDGSKSVRNFLKNVQKWNQEF